MGPRTLVSCTDGFVMFKYKSLVHRSSRLSTQIIVKLATNRVRFFFTLCSSFYLFVDDVAAATKEKLSELQISTAMSCTTCGITFENRTEQVCCILFPLIHSVYLQYPSIFVGYLSRKIGFDIRKQSLFSNRNC